MKSAELLKILPPKCPERVKRAKFLMNAVVRKAEGKEVLCVSIFTLKKVELFRVFLWAGGYRTLILSDQSWSNRKIENLPYPGTNYVSYYDLHCGEQGEKVAKAFTKGISGPYDTISYYQQAILAERESRRTKEKKEPVQELLSRIPELPEDFEQQILDGPLLHSRYIFYESKLFNNPLTGERARYYVGYCTHCQATIEFDHQPTHKEWDICPNCRSTVSTRKRYVSRSYLQDRTAFAIFQKSGQEVFLSYFDIERDYSHDPEYVRTKITQTEVFWFGRGQVRRFVSEYQWGGGQRWAERKSLTGALIGCSCYEEKDDVFRGTVLEHCHLEDYVRIFRENIWNTFPVAWLVAYTKHPAVEHLLSAGLTNLCREIVNSKHQSCQAVDWKAGTRPRDILHLPEPEIRKLAQYNLSSREITLYQKERENGFPLDDSGVEMLRMVNDVYNPNDMDRIKEVGICPLLKYFMRQRRKHYRDTALSTIYRQWVDYLSMASRLGEDFEKDRFPHNLKKAHDRVANLVNEQERIKMAAAMAMEKREWRRQYLSLLPLSWQADGLFIRPVRDREELLQEGQKLEHCVSGYGDRVKTGGTHILLIRRIDAPETPFYTLNLSRDGKFIQCHGFKNDLELPGGQRPQEIQDFEQKWMKEVVEPFFKERAKTKEARKKREKEKTAELSPEQKKTGKKPQNKHRKQETA